MISRLSNLTAKLAITSTKRCNASMIVHMNMNMKLCANKTVVRLPQMQIVRDKSFKKALKTKKAVLKRLTLTGKGIMKATHSGKSHLNMNKGRHRVKRLSNKVINLSYCYILYPHLCLHIVDVCLTSV